MKKVIICFFSVLTTGLLNAQDYPQWPADKPETGFIEDAQGKTRADYYGLLPQEVAMQDKMRSVFTNMMQNASAKLGWKMVEISEYTNSGPMQGGIEIPYNLRSPRAIVITFQFIVNNDSLQAWKTYETNYENRHLAAQQSDYGDIQSAMQGPLYKRYKDSADHYMKLYLQYTEAHKDEGVALYTTDKHPKYYQQKEAEFMDKAVAITNGQHESAGIETMEYKHEKIMRRFRNHTALTVRFQANEFVTGPINLEVEPTLIYSVSSYPEAGAKVSKMYSFSEMRGGDSAITKWNNTILFLLGNFVTKPNEAGLYEAGFNNNGQGDEHTPKKIKSDKVQNISVNISGSKNNIEKMAKLIDVAKLNGTIVKQ